MFKDYYFKRILSSISTLYFTYSYRSNLWTKDSV